MEKFHYKPELFHFVNRNNSTIYRKNSTMEKFHYGKIPLCFKCEQYQIAKFILLKTAKNYTILYIC